MRSFFITTETNNCDPVMQSYKLGPIDGRFKFWCMGPRQDGNMVLAVERWARSLQGGPGVIMYIGAVPSPQFGVGVPGIDTLRMVGKVAPTIHVCFDGADSPWWAPLEAYKAAGCFAAQVNIDGGKCAPADLVTLCPVETAPYDGPEVERDIRLGFAGGVGTPLRWHMVKRLEEVAGLQIRARQQGYETPDYAEYAGFMRRCRMVLNVPVTGSGQFMHVKSRVIEAGLAGCAVLEHKDSPAHGWFPGALIPFGTMEELEALAVGMPEAVVAEHGRRLSGLVRREWHPDRIWGDMLRVAGFGA